MNKIKICILIFFCNIAFAQIGFNVEFEADYKLDYKEDKQNSQRSTAAFALLINNSSSYFKNINKYISDSLIYEKKIKSTGDKLKDANRLMQYFTDFNENIGISGDLIYVSLPIENKVYEYREKNNIQWEIQKDVKKINGYVCQKAITTKYGRKWIAYFTKDIPFPFGPHKFNNLPGLSVELFDDKNDYHFTMYRFQKRKYYLKSANMNYNSVSTIKEKVFDYRRKQIGDISRFQNAIADPDMLSEVIKKTSDRAKNFNPLELKIY